MTAAPVGAEPDRAPAPAVPPPAVSPPPSVAGLMVPAADRRAPVWPGLIPPAPGAGSPDPLWWWVGAHGGAGVSTLTAVLTASADARRAWPGGYPGECPNVVLVARTHTEGLQRARDLATQYATGLVPPGVRLLGLVTIPDAAGRLPISLRRPRDLVSATVPTAWHLPWVEPWRSTRRGELPSWDPEHDPTPAGRLRRHAGLPAGYLDCGKELAAAAIAGL